MSETKLWTWLHPYLPKGAYTRIETGETGPGTPDVFYQIGPGAAGWFELKFSNSLSIPFPNAEKGLRKSQRVWIPRNVKAGGIIHIVAQVGGSILFVPGTYAQRFNGVSYDKLKEWSRLQLNYHAPVTKEKLREIKALMRGN